MAKKKAPKRVKEDPILKTFKVLMGATTSLDHDFITKIKRLAAATRTQFDLPKAVCEPMRFPANAKEDCFTPETVVHEIH